MDASDELNVAMLAEILDKAIHLNNAKAYAGSLRAVMGSLQFYRVRCEELQDYQRRLPEPHRTVICNILANGKQSAFGRMTDEHHGEG